MFTEFCSSVEISLTESWPSAAASFFRERHVEPQNPQHFHRGDSDMWFVVPHEGIVPQNNFATLLGRDAALRRPVGAARRPYQPFFKPFIESFRCVMWQRTFG